MGLCCIAHNNIIFMYFNIDITILFEFEGYSVIEGEQVEVCVVVGGNSEIDIPVEIMSHDVTANGIYAHSVL